MKSFGLTDKGTVRAENQDCFIIEKCDKKQCLIVSLCDGMGGARSGGIASHLANKAFVSYVYGRLSSRNNRYSDIKSVLYDACIEANALSYDYSKFDAEFTGMGTTLVGGIIYSNGEGKIVNVGDSRAYHISRKTSEIYQVTRDHSLVEDLVSSGAITREEAKNHPQKNVITRAVGSEEFVNPDYYEFTLLPGDVLLLCSDGLTNTVTDMELLDYAGEYYDAELLCRALMKKALNRGAKDNVTVVAVSR